MNALYSMSPISLEEMNSEAELLQRFDVKYLVRLDHLDDILKELSNNVRVLEKEGVRSTPYLTTYYDSLDFHTYFDHLKQRRKRFKIRSRSYADSRNGFLEIKIKMSRGQTQKVRWPVDVAQLLPTITDNYVAQLNEALLDSSYEPLSHQYSRSLTTTFSRTTLFDSTTQERTTIDVGLAAHTDVASINLGHQFAIIEVKSPTATAQTVRMFSQLGIRPVNVSKYCIAMTALHPDMRGAPWRNAVRLLEGVREKPENHF